MVAPANLTRHVREDLPFDQLLRKLGIRVVGSSRDQAEAHLLQICLMHRAKTRRSRGTRLYDVDSTEQALFTAASQGRLQTQLLACKRFPQPSSATGRSPSDQDLPDERNTPTGMVDQLNTIAKQRELLTARMAVEYLSSEFGGSDLTRQDNSYPSRFLSKLEKSYGLTPYHRHRIGRQWYSFYRQADVMNAYRRFVGSKRRRR